MSWTAPTAFAACTLAIGLGAIFADSGIRLPGDHQGYEPEQPIHFSHRVHAGELGMDCLACHWGAETSRHAGVPPLRHCMGCHQHVTADFDTLLEEKLAATAEEREPRVIVSDELRKLYDALALDAELKPDPDGSPQPVEWVRVHKLPDYVYFDHRVHVTRGLACEQCHGPVASMERIRQESDLSMGWCMDCHRTSPAELVTTASGAGATADHVSVDCVRCHY